MAVLPVGYITDIRNIFAVEKNIECLAVVCLIGFAGAPE